MNKNSFLYLFNFGLIILVMIMLASNVLHSQTFIPAEIIGGKKQFKEFVDMEMQFPENAIKEKVKGNVELSFIVDNSGDIIGINVKESLNNEVDNEAIRILKKTQWEAAKKFGKNVASRNKILINFNYKKYKRLCKKRGYTKIYYPHLPVDTSNKIFDLEKSHKRPSPIFKERFYSIDKFIINNLKYPDAAFNQNISGLVILNFIVEPHGHVSHIIVEKHVGGGCNEEAIRVIKLIKWNPGIIDKKAARVKMSIKVMFKLPDNSDHQYLPNNQNNTM